MEIVGDFVRKPTTVLRQLQSEVLPIRLGHVSSGLMGGYLGTTSGVTPTGDFLRKE